MRAARPEVVFGADIIAGFPTETEAMFEHSLRLVEECGLTWLHVFPYSARAGTPAARMPQVDGRRDPRAGGAAARRRRRAGPPHLAEMPGREVRLLMERPDLGRTEGFARTLVTGEHLPGSILRARVTGTQDDMLLAEAA